MPHDFQQGFYMTTPVAAVTPATKIVNPNTQVSTLHGENTANVATHVNDIKKQ